jgi:hypothetical protein
MQQTCTFTVQRAAPQPNESSGGSAGSLASTPASSSLGGAASCVPHAKATKLAAATDEQTATRPARIIGG